MSYDDAELRDKNRDVQVNLTDTIFELVLRMLHRTSEPAGEGFRLNFDLVEKEIKDSTSMTLLLTSAAQLGIMLKALEETREAHQQMDDREGPPQDFNPEIMPAFGEIKYYNETDSAGMPTGGWARTVGLEITWQDGPILEAGGRNGAGVEDAIVAARARLSYYQGSPFAHRENGIAIEYLDAALAALHRRRTERILRGVEGTHER